MPRDRLRDQGLTERQRTQARIAADIGIGGRVRMDGLPGRGGGIVGSSPVVVQAGNDIHHITLGAVAGQTIAAGGATVQWGTVAGAPTEVRGFPSALAELAESGVIGAIPIGLTGEMEVVLDGLWTEYRAAGEITITRTRDGVETARTFDLGPARSRLFGGNTVGWAVRVGDTVTVALPNDSGSDATLQEATVGIRIIGTADATSPPEPEGPWAWYRGDDLEGSQGETVDTWSDRSGNGRDVESWSANTDRHPTIADLALDGHRGADFTGGFATSLERQLDGTYTPSGWTVFQVFADVDQGSSSETVNLHLGDGLYLYFETGGAATSAMDLQGTSGSLYVEWAPAGGVSGTVWMSAQVDTASMVLDGNGTEVASDTGGGTTDATQIGIGATGRGVLLETIIFDRVLSAADEARWVSYLAERYPSLGIS